MLESVLIKEVRAQAAGMRIAVARLDEALQAAPAEFSDDVFWHDVHAALSCAAMVSKVLWGGPKNPPPEVVARRTRIRVRLGVPDGSVVHDRFVRNGFEHFDERVETWWQEDPNHNIADRSIGPRDRTIVGLPEGSFMHWFDPESQVVYVVKDSVNLRALFDAVTEIGMAAARLLEAPWWEWPIEP
jgi:hypothetical protein